MSSPRLSTNTNKPSQSYEVRLRKILTKSHFVRSFVRVMGVGWMILATVFLSFGGIEVFLQKQTLFSPNVAQAVYSGKTARTIEIPLGGGTDATSRASTDLV